MEYPKIPVATYRLQFNRLFRFRDATEIAGYLQALGISEMYASPFFAARPGSLHGYDITDPSSLNPELGTPEELNVLSTTLRSLGLGLVLDIVPNHMAATPDNPWWRDVLEYGRLSHFARFFDIDWRIGRNRLMLPLLEVSLQETLDRGGCCVSLTDYGLALDLGFGPLPLTPASYPLVLVFGLSRNQPNISALETRRWADVFENLVSLTPVATALDRMPSGSDRTAREAKAAFLDLVTMSSAIRERVTRAVEALNRRSEQAVAVLRRLVDVQAYRPVPWRDNLVRRNYRRFFDINDLVALRIERPHVFRAVHQLLFNLIEDGWVTGLRVDHIDGLYDPRAYLGRLSATIHSRVSERVYMVVEKILTGDERLQADWPVDGTTGYEFANAANGVLVHPRGLHALQAFHGSSVGAARTLEEVAYGGKKRVVPALFFSEIRTLSDYLRTLARSVGRTGLSLENLSKAIIEVTACLPVYRTYLRGRVTSKEDRRYIDAALRRAKANTPPALSAAVDFLGAVLQPGFAETLSHRREPAWRLFLMKWQQLTGAAMAKGFEDHALYDYHRLLSLNEVGGNPSSYGLSVTSFHRWNRRRAELTPRTLNTTSTHDTKRSGDVRARITVLSEMSGEYRRAVVRWRRLNASRRQSAEDKPVPEPAVEDFIYQTMIGAWPLFPRETEEFTSRLRNYMVKASREARRNTSWQSPDEDYENDLKGFISAILEPSPGNRFLPDFIAFQQRVAPAGAVNSLAQLLLKIASPGIPDFYQGSELWDFSLVDPDNRTPVDFTRRRDLLERLLSEERQGVPALVCDLVENWQDGRIKLFLTRRALRARADHPAVFSSGRYTPLHALGSRRHHIIAFARDGIEASVIVAVPRWTYRLTRGATLLPAESAWEDTVLAMPESPAREWQDVFTGRAVRLESPGILLSRLFRDFPAAMLVGVD